MGLIEYYIIFALATAIAADLGLYRPSLMVITATNPENALAQHPHIGAMVFFCVSLVMAPVIIVPVLVPSIGSRFCHSFEQSVLQE